MREEMVIEALQSWQTLNEKINELTEDELYLALNTEMDHDKRNHFVIRIHARHTRIKAKREREELLRRCKGK